jgi:Polysaccharide biosynthesis enzyme WcbI
MIHIVIAGLCQSWTLKGLMDQLPSMKGRVRFTVLNALGTGEAADVFPDECEDVTLLWDGAGPNAHRPAQDATLAWLRARCRRIAFPVVYPTAYWPFLRMPPPRWQAFPPYYPHGMYGWGDAVADAVAALNLDAAAAMGAYHLNFKSHLPDLRRMVELDVLTQKQKDQSCDVVMAPYVEANLLRTLVTWGPGHLAGEAACYLATQLVRSSEPELGPVNSTIAELEALATNYQGLDDAQLPIHPLTAEQLGLPFYDPTASYRWYFDTFDHDTYITHYMARTPLGGPNEDQRHAILANAMKAIAEKAPRRLAVLGNDPETHLALRTLGAQPIEAMLHVDDQSSGGSSISSSPLPGLDSLLRFQPDLVLLGSFSRANAMAAAVKRLEWASLNRRPPPMVGVDNYWRPRT